MPCGVPLIRAAGLTPMVRWMTANGRPVAAWLRAADLSYLPLLTPEHPVPLISAAAFLREFARHESPDIGCRIAFSMRTIEIAMMGKVALGGRTPRESLVRVAAALPHFSTNEHFTFAKIAGGRTLVRYFWSTKFDVETLHLIQQFVSALICVLCRLTGSGDPLFARVEMIPHPEFGLDHLRPWIEAPAEPAGGQTLDLLIEDVVLDRPFRNPARDRKLGERLSQAPPLLGDGSLAGSARLVIAAMLEGGTPSTQRLAKAAGLSLRTLQRRLKDENSSFSELLDDVRRAHALSGLGAGRQSITDLSVKLGFATPAAFTRAVRRWTGRPPSYFRKGGTN